jgi:hypothetical protein
MDLPSFEEVSREEFEQALERSAASPGFRKQYGRFAPHVGESYMLHLGHLKTTGHFRAPGYCTLVTGNLDVDAIVDLQNPDGYDEGGLFIVLGNLTCHSFFNEYGKCTFVDGNLDARDLLVAAFGDSALSVVRHLSTNFFYGEDIWAEVGAGATMEYGAGYCLPIGYTAAAAEAITPNHDEATSLALLNVARSNWPYPHALREHLVAGKPLLKRQRGL